MNAAEYNRRRERADAFRAFVRHPAFVGTLAGIALTLILLRVFG